MAARASRHADDPERDHTAITVAVVLRGCGYRFLFVVFNVNYLEYGTAGETVYFKMKLNGEAAVGLLDRFESRLDPIGYFAIFNPDSGQEVDRPFREGWGNPIKRASSIYDYFYGRAFRGNKDAP